MHGELSEGFVVPESRDIQIQVNLRIPIVKEPRKDASGYPINSANVRFIRDAVVPALPQLGEVLMLETKGGASLACEVHQAQWNEAIGRFIVYCKYASRSIPADAYNALLDDPDWTMRPLL